MVQSIRTWRRGLFLLYTLACTQELGCLLLHWLACRSGPAGFSLPEIFWTSLSMSNGIFFRPLYVDTRLWRHDCISVKSLGVFRGPSWFLLVDHRWVYLEEPSWYSWFLLVDQSLGPSWFLLVDQSLGVFRVALVILTCWSVAGCIWRVFSAAPPMSKFSSPRRYCWCEDETRANQELKCDWFKFSMFFVCLYKRKNYYFYLLCCSIASSPRSTRSSWRWCETCPKYLFTFICWFHWLAFVVQEPLIDPWVKRERGLHPKLEVLYQFAWCYGFPRGVISSYCLCYAPLLFCLSAIFSIGAESFMIHFIIQGYLETLMAIEKALGEYLEDQVIIHFRFKIVYFCTRLLLVRSYR